MTHTDDQDVSKKNLILKMTLELIKQEGVEELTIRKIASAADVNVGLVNYHFGSKNKLINEVIQILVKSLKDSFEVLEDASLPPKERLKRFLVKYIHTYHQYPFIARQILNHDVVIFDSQKEFVNFMKAFGVKKVQNTIAELTGETDSEQLTIMMSHILGGVFLPTLIEPLYEKVTGLPLADDKTRIEVLLERYFPEES